MCDVKWNNGNIWRGTDNVAVGIIPRLDPGQIWTTGSETA